MALYLSAFCNKALSVVYKLIGCISCDVVGRLQRQQHYQKYRRRDMQLLHT